MATITWVRSHIIPMSHPTRRGLFSIVAPALVASAPGQEPCPAQLQYGQVIECSIAQPGTQRTHGFAAARGDGIVIQVTSANLTPHIEVWRPDGSISCGPGYGELICSALDQTGRHTIMVRDEYGSKTGAYSLSLRRAGDAALDRPPDQPSRVGDDPIPDDPPGTNHQSLTAILVAIIGATATIVAAWLGTRARRRARK